MEGRIRRVAGTPQRDAAGPRASRGLAVAIVLGLLAAPVALAGAGVVWLGPAHTGWILWPSGAASSLGAGTIRTAILAVVASVLLSERRWWAAGYVLASSTLVHVASRVGKRFWSRSRPLDPQTGWALPRFVVIAVLVGVLIVGLAVVTDRRRSAWWLLPFCWGAAVVVDQLARLIPVAPGSDSFPSGHASNTMAIALAVAMVAVGSPRLRLLAEGAAGFAVLVGISRLTLGFHRPIEVLGGWAIALAITVGLRQLVGADRLSGPSSSSVSKERAV